MFKSRPPRGGGKLPYYDWVKLQPGKCFEGWCAGPLVGVEVHYVKGSRACRQVLTNGALTCAYCAEGMPTTWRGYVPLWDQAGIRCVSIVGERYADLAAKLVHLEPVRVTKTMRQGTPIRVEPCAWTSTRPPIEGDALKPQDLQPWLVRLWSDAALSLWIAENPVEPESATLELLTPSKVVTFDMGKVDAESKKRKAAKPAGRDEPPAHDAIDTPLMREQIAKFLKTPAGENGHAKKKGGKK